VSSLEDQNIEDYTQGLARNWGVGKQHQDNGIVFLIAPKERQMRIEVASGVRSILTDSNADRIRDSVVLPSFRSGDMAQGIIDGAHSIMRTFDVSVELEVTEKKTQPTTSRKWTSEDTKIIGYILGGFAVVMFIWRIIMIPIRHSQTRKYVLKARDRILSRFAALDKVAKNTDIKEGTRTELERMRDEFSSIDQLMATGKNCNWIKLREKLDSMNRTLKQIASIMNCEIAFAEMAKQECPDLLRKIPDMIELVSNRLAEGESSPEAMMYLEKARMQYERMQILHSGMTVTDWVILYEILSNIQLTTAKAESMHRYANTDHSSNHSSRSSNSRSSHGFGDNSGFGGGGGFTGGGSSGSW
jgi:uncharacterized membrane protein YgcG